MKVEKKEKEAKKSFENRCPNCGRYNIIELTKGNLFDKFDNDAYLCQECGIIIKYTEKNY